MTAPKFEMNAENWKKVAKGMMIAAAAGGLSWLVAFLSSLEVPVEFVGLVAMASGSINWLIQYISDSK